MLKGKKIPEKSTYGKNGFMVENLFPKQTLRARALEKMPPHEIEVSEGVSIFIKKRKTNILLPYRIKDGQISLKFQFLRERP